MSASPDVEGLVDALERVSDVRAREAARAVVRAVLELHAKGLAALLGQLRSQGDAGRALLRGLASAPEFQAVLLLHDLHPEPLPERVAAGLAQVRTYLRLHGSDVEFLGLGGAGQVQLRLSQTQGGCHSSPERLRRAVEDAVYEVAPDAGALEIEMVRAGPQKAAEAP